jgi:hypothetical protein
MRTVQEWDGEWDWGLMCYHGPGFFPGGNLFDHRAGRVVGSLFEQSPNPMLLLVRNEFCSAFFFFANVMGFGICDGDDLFFFGKQGWEVVGLLRALTTKCMSYVVKRCGHLIWVLTGLARLALGAFLHLQLTTNIRHIYPEFAR